MKSSKLEPNKPLKKASQTEPSSEPDVASLPFDLLGLQKQPNQVPLLYLQAPGGSIVPIPITACAASKHAQLHELLLRAGFIDTTSRMPIKAVSALLLRFAATTKVHVLTEVGIQSIEVKGGKHRVMVKGGSYHWLGAPPSEDVQVTLVGQAATAARQLPSHQKFLKAFRPLLSRQPRLLVVLLFALASEIASEFDTVLVALLLVGPSSIGKTIAQRTSSRLITGEDSVEQLDATPQGLIERLQAQASGSVYFEDVHLDGAWEPMSAAVMAAGNGAKGRIRSRHSRVTNSDAAIKCTLIMSAEASFAGIASAGRGTLLTGQYARLLEIWPGPNGFFDHLCGFANSANLASHVEELSSEFAGVVGHSFFQLVATRWETLQPLWLRKRDSIHASILKHAGLEEVSGMTHRISQALTFVGFVGAITAHHGVLPIKPSDVFKALGLVLGEQVNRLRGATTPVAQAVMEAVRTFIESNAGKFLPIEQAGSSAGIGIAGYVKRTKQGTLYLFIPGVFKERFVSKFGMEAYGHLRAAGLLVTKDEDGNQLQVRMPSRGNANEEVRQRFVAISGAILQDDV